MAWLTKKRIEILLALIVVIGLTIAALYVLQGPAQDQRRFLSFSISAGETFKSVSLRLKAEGVVRSEPFFYYMGRISGKSGHLKAGEYELNNEMTAWEVLKVITGSHVKLYRVTFKEGMTMFQVAQTLEDAGLVDSIQFLETCWDPVLLRELNIPSPTVEGYLFPETYFIPRGSSPRAIIRMMTEMFWTKIPDAYLDRARKSSLSFHEMVVMASMIEKETGLVGEMSLISSVFYNRLEDHMRLQSDPTAIYDIAPLGGRVTREHLFRKTPFNTYQIEGLPMTPIGNPGILSVQAALAPQSSTYLYFVSRRDGSHHFSSTYDEHREAIERYLQ